MSEATLSKSSYFKVFLALLVLLSLSVAASFVQIEDFALTVAMGIAVVKTILVVLFFMHVRFSNRLIQVFILVSVLWLFLLLGLTLNDYATRHWDAAGTTWPPYSIHQKDTSFGS